MLYIYNGMTTKKSNTKKKASDKETTQSLLGNVNANVEQLLEQAKRGFVTDKIGEVSACMSHDFYGNTDYENRKGYVIHTEGGLTFFIGIPKRLPDSHLGAFMQLYGSEPRKGMTINIDITGTFDKIKLA